MRRRSRQRPFLAAVVALVAVLVAGCGSGGDDGGGSGAQGGGSSTLTVAWASVPPQMDPNNFTGLPTVYAIANVMGTLLEYDETKGGDRVLGVEDLTAGLAESWEPNQDNTAYTLKLREGVRSPAGNELTADDVVWSFERMLAEETSLAAGVLMPSANVDTDKPVEKIDRYTVRYNLESPSAVSLAILAYPVIGIFDSVEAKKHATSEDPWANKWLATHSASFGPYTLESLRPNQEVRFRANPNYHGDKPGFERVVLRAVAEGSSRAQLLLSGEVDMIADVPIDQLERLRGNDRVQLVEQPDTNRHSVALNTRDRRLNDPRVRRALSLAVNRQAIVDAIYKGAGKPAETPLSSALVPDQADRVLPNPQEARRLLAEAGYGDGFDLTLTINPSRPGPFVENLARLIQGDWNRIGVRTNVRTIPSTADFEEAVASKSLQAYLYSERPAFADPGYAMFLYLSSKSVLNNTGYSNAQFDRLIVDILATQPGEQRDELIERASAILARDVPSVYLVEVPDLKGLRQGITGYVSSPTGATAFHQLRPAG